MNQDKRDKLLQAADAICEQLAELSIDERIDAINKIRRKIHEVSPFKDNPVDFVEWVESDLVEKNDYNPNLVASPEMRALKDSIVEDGYTQPIVGWITESKITVVDGFHRNLVGRDKKVAKKLFNRLPIANIRGDRTNIEDRIKSTVRHNRARGKHQIEGMATIVAKLKEGGVSDIQIAKGLGMEGEELLRLKQQTGLPELFRNAKHSRAWKNKGDFSPDKLS